MEWKQLLARLQLDDEAIRYQKVEPRLPDRHVFVRDRERYLPGEADAAQSKFHAHGLLVDGFEQTGAQNAVDFYGCLDDDASYLIESEIRFRQFGVFGALAVHTSDIGLPASRLPRCRAEAVGACRPPVTPRAARERVGVSRHAARRAYRRAPLAKTWLQGLRQPETPPPIPPKSGYFIGLHEVGRKRSEPM